MAVQHTADRRDECNGWNGWSGRDEPPRYDGDPRDGRDRRPGRPPGRAAARRAAPVERSLDSVAWKINSEIVLLLGWNPAILLQVAHPLVAAGVVEHSLFLTDPAGRARRLWRTLNVMFDLTFGTPTEVQRAADAINAVHDRVHGRLRRATGPFEAGRWYSAHDPELLRWVHCTMLEVFPRTYRLYVGRLTDAEWDRYCAEASRVEPLLGVPDGFLPDSLPALRAYLRAMLAGGQVAVGEESRLLAREILRPRLPLTLRPLLPFFQLPMVGLLPPSVRAAYGLAWDARHERLLRHSARLVRPLLASTPSLLRHWPAARRAFARARRGELEPPAPRPSAAR
jgi:uncharacterized protein (DUF2236 family)